MFFHQIPGSGLSSAAFFFHERSTISSLLHVLLSFMPENRDMGFGTRGLRRDADPT